jgi:hypothetical protein
MEINPQPSLINGELHIVYKTRLAGIAGVSGEEFRSGRGECVVRKSVASTSCAFQS